MPWRKRGFAILKGPGVKRTDESCQVVSDGGSKGDEYGREQLVSISSRLVVKME